MPMESFIVFIDKCFNNITEDIGELKKLITINKKEGRRKTWTLSLYGLSQF